MKRIVLLVGWFCLFALTAGCGGGGGDGDATTINNSTDPPSEDGDATTIKNLTDPPSGDGDATTINNLTDPPSEDGDATTIKDLTDPPSEDVVDLPDDQAISCGRNVRNLLSANARDLSNWSVFPSKRDIVFFNDSRSAKIDMANTDSKRLFFGKGVSLRKNRTYAFRVKILDVNGAFDDVNFAIIGGDPSDFTGTRNMNFSNDGVYGLVFNYTGDDNVYIYRIGVGVHRNDPLAIGNAGFVIEEIMWEELPLLDNSPSEYIWPGNRWGFSYEKANLYDHSNGRVTDLINEPCGDVYKRGWAITADSFGNDSFDFAQQLLNEVALEYAFYINSVSGRTLNSASNTFLELVNLESYPSNVAKPYGIIIQGGVNDIVRGAALKNLQVAVNRMLQIAKDKSMQVIVLTVSPLKNNTRWSPAKETVRVSYNEWLRSIGITMQDVHVLDIAAPVSSGGLAENSDVEFLAKIYDGTDSNEYNGDGLHPNPAGGRQIAEGIKAILDGL